MVFSCTKVQATDQLNLSEQVQRPCFKIWLRGITELSDDGYEGVSALSEAFKSMAGIDIFDEATGQLRDTYSILEDMAEVWPTLTENQQQYLGEMAAG